MYRVIEGDCLDVLPTLEANSIDSIVTDPPYGLGFMGKAWDSLPPGVDVFRECLRVLKPGGHLLAFGGTRTYHRLAVAVEDAGFEVRDMIAWVYAQGFPKSHNLDNKRGDMTCNCSGDVLPYTHEEIPGKSQAERNMHYLRDSDVSQAVDSGERRGQVLQQSVQKQSPSTERRAQLRPTENRTGQPGVEGRGNYEAPERKLQGGALRSGAGVGDADGSQGRVHNGASIGDGADVRVSFDADGSGESHRSQPIEQRPAELGTMANERRPQKGGVWPVCSGCGKPIIPKGLGTALKPAHEPIVVARKPLTGTVAANVLEWGTGAINVDGGRVETADSYAYPNGPGGCKGGEFHYQGRADKPAESNPLGRFPANLLHDGSDEVVRLFPERDGGRQIVNQTAGSTVNAYRGYPGGRSLNGSGRGDTGSAARFFYCAKASKRDRDEGCEGLEERQIRRHSGGEYAHNSGSTNSSKNGARSRNHHPTVKPTALMRYLVRLVTPPGGTVGDPFTGSGSTGKACMYEGFNFIGIEREVEYAEIARARIEYAMNDTDEDGEQPSLFQEVTE